MTAMRQPPVRTLAKFEPARVPFDRSGACVAQVGYLLGISGERQANEGSVRGQRTREAYEGSVLVIRQTLHVWGSPKVGVWVSSRFAVFHGTLAFTLNNRRTQPKPPPSVFHREKFEGPEPRDWIGLRR
jgi:hypothetical protein